MTANAPTQKLPNKTEPIIKGTNPVSMCDNESLNLSNGGQFIKIFIAINLKFRDNIGMIKKAALLGLVLTTGCAVQTPYGPQYTKLGPYKVGLQAPPVVQQVVTDPGSYVAEQTSGYATSVLGETISDPFALAVRANSFIAGAFGPNNVSTSINKGINWYRIGLGVLNNPLEAAFIYTTPWIKN